MCIWIIIVISPVVVLVTVMVVLVVVVVVKPVVVAVVVAVDMLAFFVLFGIGGFGIMLGLVQVPRGGRRSR